MEPKKSLGQNFFINVNLGNKIIKTVLETQPKIVVEIGAGKGFFTQRLVDSGVKVIAIEKDNTLARFLKEQFPTITVINEDFLELNLNALNIEKDTVFFGSLPYNVSKPIVRNILGSNAFHNPAYFVIQKEVAEKYIAKEPNNNLLSLSSQLFSTSKKLFNISKGSFRPVPKVTSSFIRFTPLTQKIAISDLRKFQKFLKLSFTSPRKTLKNNIKKLLTEKNLDSALLSKRPQELSLQDFLDLFTLLK